MRPVFVVLCCPKISRHLQGFSVSPCWWLSLQRRTTERSPQLRRHQIKRLELLAIVELISKYSGWLGGTYVWSMWVSSYLLCETTTRRFRFQKVKESGASRIQTSILMMLSVRWTYSTFYITPNIFSWVYINLKILKINALNGNMSVSKRAEYRVNELGGGVGRIKTGLFRKTPLEIFLLHHINHAINNRMLLLAEMTKKTTGSVRRMMAQCHF